MNGEAKQSWAEAVIECVSNSAERERLIRMYDYDELVQACLALGTLALSARNREARELLARAAFGLPPDSAVATDINEYLGRTEHRTDQKEKS